MNKYIINEFDVVSNNRLSNVMGPFDSKDEAKKFLRKIIDQYDLVYFEDGFGGVREYLDENGDIVIQWTRHHHGMVIEYKYKYQIVIKV